MTKRTSERVPKGIRNKLQERSGSIWFAGLSHGKNDTNQLLYRMRNGHVVMFAFLTLLSKISSKVGIPFTNILSSVEQSVAKIL